MAEDAVNVLAILGSLRAESFNRMLLGTALDQAPAGLHVEVFDLSPIPFFNADVEAEGDPEPVAELKAAIAASDALLIVTPEYQHGVPGVLKNALDWASRPADSSVLEGKLVAVMGASPSPVGTARAQVQLRQTLMYNECRIISRPEVMVNRAFERFENGQLVDEFYLGRLTELLEKLERVARAA